MLVCFARRALCSLSLVVAGSALCAADVSFSQSDWTSLSGDTEVTLGPAAGNAWTVEPTGGNPGSWVEFSADPLNYDSWTGLLTDSWVYDPQTQGQIYSMSLSADVYAITGLQYAGTQTLLFQNGNYYFDFATAVSTGAWATSAVTGVTAADFWEIDPADGTYNQTLNPDFSSSGAPITFGYAMGVLPGVQVAEGYDNVAIDIHNTVPEPSPFVPLGVGLGIVAIRRRN